LSQLQTYLLESQALDVLIENEGLRPRINQLREWQCKRLLASYHDLYAQKRFKPAMDFFTRELYGPNDFSERDKDIEKALPLMEAALSEKTLATFGIALQLNTLSFQLDFELTKRLGPVESITSEHYAQAYQACENQDDRQVQLDYIELLANELNKIANRPSIMMVLKLARVPAKLAGLGELQRILETGAAAFQKIGKVEHFVQPILNGETELMHNLFGGKNTLPDV
jgi:hypothetical protein